MHRPPRGFYVAPVSKRSCRSLRVACVLWALWPLSSSAACEWSFNWYCPGCANIGARTTGAVGGFATEAQCENARTEWKRDMDRQGGGATTGSCSRTGICDSPPSVSPGAPRPSEPATGGSYTPEYGYPAQPAYDYEAEQRHREELERRQREEAERAEQARREEQERQQFLREKQEALKALKGVDFDSSGDSLGLKTGEDAPAIKTPPVQKTPGRGEPLFSKGTKESAPPVLYGKDPDRPFVVDPRKVANLIPDGDLGKFVASRNWTTETKGRVVLGVLQAERGRLDQALRYLERARAETPNDSFLRDAPNRLKTLKQQSRSKESDLEKAAARVPPAARKAWLAGITSIEVGDIEAAARYMRQAQKAAPDNADLRITADMYERDLADRKRELMEASRHRGFIEARRQWAQGMAAWKLGLWLIDRDQDVAAVRYLTEARDKLREPTDALLISELVNRLREGKQVKRGPPGVYYAKRVEALLDAMDYAKGDWDATLRFLSDASVADPSSRPVRDALNYTEGLRAGMGE